MVAKTSEVEKVMKSIQKDGVVTFDNNEDQTYKDFVNLIYRYYECYRKCKEGKLYGNDDNNAKMTFDMKVMIWHDLCGTQPNAGKILKVLLQLEEGKINDDNISITDWEKAKHFLANMCRLTVFITIVIPLVVWCFQYRTYGEINLWLFDTAKESKEVLQDAAVRFYKYQAQNHSIKTFADIEDLRKNAKVIKNKTLE